MRVLTLDDPVTPDDSARPALGDQPMLERNGHVSIQGVSKVFRRRGQIVEALRSVDLEIGQGEFISLLGPSGCGKSTLLRIIGGLIDADGGTAEIDGQTPQLAREARQFGLVPQTPALMPWATVERNVRLLSSLDARSATTTMQADDVDDLIDAVGLGTFRKSYPHELSGGMQQRVSLVRGFALGAPILLMDEPFAALDEITRADMRYLLLDLWQRTGTTGVVGTHSITEAVILSDRVVVMAARPGRIAAVEPISLERPRRPELEDTPAFHDHVRILREQLKVHHS